MPGNACFEWSLKKEFFAAKGIVGVFFNATFKNRNFYGNYESRTLYYIFQKNNKKKKTKQGIVARYSKSVFQTKISLVKIDAVYKVI